MDEKEYLINLQSQIRAYRAICLQVIRETLIEGTTDGATLRRLSWAYALEHSTVPKEHLTCKWPVAIGSSKVDNYHQSHFIRATLAVKYYPNSYPIDINTIAPCLCEEEPDELRRTESKVVLFEKLAGLFPEEKRKETDGWKQDILRISKETNAMVRRLLASNDKDLDI